MIRKPFDRQLHESNDKVARETAKNAFFNNYKYILDDNPDKYGPDLKAYKDGQFLGYVEVEVKQFWKDHANFPDAFMHIPERKKKFLNYSDMPDHPVPIVFCVLSADLKAGYWIEGEDLASCPLIVKSNKYVDNEKFFDIPLSKMHYFVVTPIVNERNNNESVESQSSK